MNLPNKFRHKTSALSFVPLLLLAFVVSSLTTYAQAPQLSLVDIFTALRSNKATMPEKNSILSEGVKQRGITFGINVILEKELRNAGADDSLILAISEKSPTKELAEKPVAKVAAKPKDFDYYKNRANSKFVISEFKMAIKDYDEAIKLNENEPSVFLSRGLAYYNIKQFNLAIADFAKTVELAPKESMAYYNRANALKEVGRFEEALEDYKTASELDPENMIVKNAFDKLTADLYPMPEPDKTVAKVETPNVNKTDIEAKPETNGVKQSNEKSAISDGVMVKLTNIGTLQKLAVKLAVPKYPIFERQRNIGGLIKVEVTLDKEGKVISATAINGPRALRKASEDAVNRSRFNPYKLNDVAVSVKGFISYNFKVN